MNAQTDIKLYIEDVFKTNKLAVLATERKGQPHASLITMTPVDGFMHLLFATYRSTRKYMNLTENGKVAVLFENSTINNQNQHEVTALTAFGFAKEVHEDEYQKARQTHLMKHPTLDTFLASTDCALFQIEVDAYQLVLSIDEVKWWNIKEQMR